jgi:uncharacterized protein
MNALTWFEIPAADIARATRFYETLLGVSLRQEPMGPQQLAVFPYDAAQGVGGCLMAGPGMVPAQTGAMVYLPATPSLDAVLARLEAAGGRLSTPKVVLPDGMGVFAHIEDSEGNRVGLHAAS